MKNNDTNKNEQHYNSPTIVLGTSQTHSYTFAQLFEKGLELYDPIKK